MKNRALLLLSLLFFLVGCEVKPKKINFGTDACHFCKMTIVDTQHAAQFVTTKGKAYKFDAIECMVNQLKVWDGPEIKLTLVSDYSNQTELIDAKNATYLISESIPSPMGAFLSSFEMRENAERIKSESGGEILTWKQLQSKL